MAGRLLPTADNLSHDYYDSIASIYDAMLSDNPRTHWIREAFHDLVHQSVPAGSTLLDFGCGTGTDAKWYAAHGYNIVAYDQSSGMIQQLEEKCAVEIRDGLISTVLGDKSTLLREMQKIRSVQGIVSNFAVVNEVFDLAELFDCFSKCLDPGGRLVVSALNPIMWTVPEAVSIRRRIIGHVSGGRLAYHVVKPGTVLHSTQHLEDASGLRFIKVAQAGVGMFVNESAGRLDWTKPSGLGERIERRVWKTRPFSQLGRFIFTVWKKKVS